MKPNIYWNFQICISVTVNKKNENLGNYFPNCTRQLLELLSPEETVCKCYGKAILEYFGNSHKNNCN